MSKVNVINTAGEEQTAINLKKEIFAIEPNQAVLHDAIKLVNDSLRQGTASTKTRAEVRGGGRKPHRQKKTGRARAGSTRSPIWMGGGVTFGPKPRSYDKKMNRKERQLALKSALSVKNQNNEIVVLKDFQVASPKTKDVKEILNNIGATKKALIIVHELDENIILATRNLDYVYLLEVSEINVYDILNSEKMFITEEALKIIEEVLV